MVSFSPDARTAEIEMRAILFVLVAFAFIDGSFDASERSFIRDVIDELIEQRAHESFGADEVAKSDVVPRWRAHFYHAIAGMEHDINVDFTESVAQGESSSQFVVARLKLRCLELLERLHDANRVAVLDMVERLMHADGIVHPSERAFRDDLRALLDEEPTRIALTRPAAARRGETVVEDAVSLPLRRVDHGFFAGSEHAYSTDRDVFARQAAGDIELMRRFAAQLNQQRTKGQGRLGAAKSFTAFAGQDPFLDGYVQVVPPRAGTEYELVVLGDLHGCYTCLKAALLQADFFAKVEAYQADPARAPYPMLVFLGDYIDRGKHSYDGILRTVMRLFLAAPDHVVVLRGNHEHYMEREGRVMSPVLPAEAIASIAPIAPRELLVAQMRLFDLMPCFFNFERFLFVHGGIPRDDTMAKKLTTLAALNDPEIRLQMVWSDPSDAEFVPLDLQRANARFPFGRMQFRSFMAQVGCSVMVRGHERVVEGLRKVYGDPDATLLSLFSSGGANNDDLPADSNYREVTPMALVLRHKDGVSRIVPFPIAYERYNHPSFNAFARAKS